MGLKMYGKIKNKKKILQNFNKKEQLISLTYKKRHKKLHRLNSRGSINMHANFARNSDEPPKFTIQTLEKNHEQLNTKK